MATTSPTTRNGLSTAEAAARRVETGPNVLPEPAPPHLATRVGRQVRDPLILVLLAAMGVTAALRDVADLVVIGLVIVLNTTVGVVQEVRADRAVAALRRLAAPTARVVRDGSPVVLPAADLVPGDLIQVQAGDVVPADATLTEAVRLTVDESALTGESVPVRKNAAAVSTMDKATASTVDGAAASTVDELAAGTVVATGRGVAVVVRTGADSALGRIAALVAATPHRRTPLQRRLAGLGRTLAVATVVLSLVVLISGLLRGLPLADMVLAAVSLTVAAVPESLPAVVTVALALGARRMARRHAIVRRLPAVETLGSVTVIAADKTGTLTEGAMTVERVVLPDGTTETLTGAGYEPGPVVDRPSLSGVALAMLLCNDADLAAPRGDDGRWSAVGDLMEAALISAAARCAVPPQTRDAYPRVAEIPFDDTRLRMTTVHARPDGGFLVACKGAPERMLAADGPLRIAPEVRDRMRATAHELGADGYRVLAVATRRTDRVPHDPERDLDLLGLVALIDPVRAEAGPAVAEIGRAGIRLLLVTGDHPATAATIAGRVGLPAQRVITGGSLPGGPLPAAHVFARIRPEQKLSIVRALQQGGEVVAMTGDGVNDAPALRAADIGVAMGRGGTEAARQAADLVLADDNIATVAAAVEEGRRIYTNIRRFLTYALSGGLAEVAVMLIGPFLGLAVPLLPAQILWINMLTHGLPGVALGAEPAERTAMDRPPRTPDEAILGDGLAGRVLVTGGMITAVALTAAAVAQANGRPWQSVLFTVLGLAQLGVALAIRGEGPRNRSLDLAVASSLILQLGGVWLGPLRSLLGTAALTPADVALCAVAATVPGLVTFLLRSRRDRSTAARTWA
jgi:Ca2+-transporting ATPase